MNLQAMSDEVLSDNFYHDPPPPIDPNRRLRLREQFVLLHESLDDDTYEALAEEGSEWDGSERAVPIEDFGGLMGWTGG